MTPRVVPVAGDSSEDTALGRPENGAQPLLEPPSGPCATETLLLVGAARLPESLRHHMARTFEMEWIEATFEEVAADLRVTLTGPEDRIRAALVILPEMYVASRRRR